MIWGPRLYGGYIGIKAKKMETTIEGLGLKVEGLGFRVGSYGGWRKSCITYDPQNTERIGV